MQIGEEKVGTVLVIAPVGRVDSVSSGELEKAVLSRIDGGERRVVLDLAGVEYISSAGLRVLLMAAKRLKEPPGALVLCGMGPGVRTVLALAGFLPLFVVEPAREQALARIGAAPA
jgi:stage II sporulation protein AA (anti-sigma F factor antagonist)